MSGYHTRDGWWFERGDTGEVIVSRARGGDNEPLERIMFFPPGEWASIGTHVSGATDNIAETFEAVKALHGAINLREMYERRGYISGWQEAHEKFRDTLCENAPKEVYEDVVSRVPQK